MTCPKNTQNEWGQDARVVYAVAGVSDEPPETRRDPQLILTAGDALPDATTVTLPHAEEWGAAETFVTAFITRVGDATELSAGAGESSGYIEVINASCEPTPHIELRIDATTLDSEYIDGGNVTAQGYVQAG